MTLSDLLAAVYEDTNYAASPPAAVTTRLTRYLNEGVTAVLAEPGLARLIDAVSPFTFASVADQERYALPDAIDTIYSVRDLSNDRALDALSLQAYRRMEPDPTDRSGTPVAWVPLGRSSVAQQLSTADEVFAISTSASDTNTVYLECVLSDGTKRQASQTMTGTTGVSIDSSLATVVSIVDVYLGTAAVGTVTIREGSGMGAVLATILPGQTRARYQILALYPTPSGAFNYAVDYRAALSPLVNSTDEPPLPVLYHPMLVKYAAFREWEHKDDTRATIAFQQYEKWLSRLKYALHQTGDSLPVAGRTRPAEYSRLGGYFPAQKW